jgi:hypothetical protein
MSADRNQDESYFDAVRTLRDSVRLAPERAADIERRLDNAFATHHAIRTPTVKRVESGWWRWMAAAAAVVLAAASVAVWRERAITQNHVIEASRPRADGNLAATSHPSGTSLAPADAHDAPLSTATSAAAARNTDRLRTARVPAHQRPVPKAAQIDVIEPAGFVAVPGAASLPQFESGTIVRLELPVSVLPEYGVDIFPAAGQPVEADVLVGQDGQARAIRLVTQSVRSSQ